jgi:hypothetical protein
MFNSRNAKRLGAIVIALGITFFTNYAISFAARSGQALPGFTPKPTQQRSGQALPGFTPKPAQERSGQALPGFTPKP